MNVRALPAPLDWRWLAVLPVVIVNAYLVVDQIAVLSVTAPWAAADWRQTFVPVVTSANPYDVDAFLWSPLAVPLLAVVVPLGLVFWRALHVAVLPLLGWRTAALVAVSWPFWWDLSIAANVGIFVLVAAWGAVHGSRVGTVAFLILTVLMPRPLVIPVLAWLLWKRPEVRGQFAVIFTVHLALMLATGLGDEWVRALLTRGETSYMMGNAMNVSPSRWLGWAWVPFGTALAAWLTWKGRLGLACLAMSPYVLPYYLLLGFLELRRLDDALVDPVSIDVQIARRAGLGGHQAQHLE